MAAAAHSETRYAIRFLAILTGILTRVVEITGGTLSFVVPLHTSSLLFLVGGGRSPRYPPNKVILWNDALAQEVAELEFREKVRGLACRRGWLAVALRRRVVVFQIEETVVRYGEWDTCDNPRGAYPASALSARQMAPSPQNRSSCASYCCLFYTVGDSWPPDGTYTARAPTALPTSTTDRSPITHAATTAASGTHKASGIDHRCPHDCPQHAFCTTIRPSACYYLLAWDFDPIMGHQHGEACEGVPERQR